MIFEEDKMMERYSQDISHYPLITPEREIELAHIIHNSHNKKAVQKAKSELTLSNLRLVVKIAADIYNKVKGGSEMNLSLMDLIQAGNMGLMTAVEHFDPSSKDANNAKFCTYAYSSIERFIKRALKESRFIRVPPNYYKWMKDIQGLEDEYGKELTDGIIAKKLKIGEDTVKVIQRNKYPSASIDEMTETIGFDAVDENDGEANRHKKELLSYVYDKMKELRPIERDILFYMFLGHSETNYKIIGDKFGLTRERIRQLYMGSIRKLRNKIERDEKKKERERKEISYAELKKRNKQVKQEVSNTTQENPPKRSYRSYGTRRNASFIKQIEGRI